MSERNSPPPKKTDKQLLIDNINTIDKMTTVEEIDAFKVRVSTSKSAERVKFFLYKACNLKLLQMRDRANLMATHGDMDDFN